MRPTWPTSPPPTTPATAASVTSGRPPSSPAAASARSSTSGGDCIGRYGGLAMFWHDQTKVGNYDAAIRIPERLYGLLAERQRKTLDRFTARYGYRPAGEQRAGLALFPTIYRSQDGTVPLTHQWFYSRFRPWVDAMDLGHYVPHQARHILSALFLCVAIAAIGRQADLRPALLGYLLLAAACCGTCETGQPARSAGELRHGYDRTRRLRREGTPWRPGRSWPGPHWHTSGSTWARSLTEWRSTTSTSLVLSLMISLPVSGSRARERPTLASRSPESPHH